MRNGWTEISEGSGVYLCTYVFDKFGPANSLLLEYKQGHCAIMSAPPKPDQELVEYAASKGKVDAIIISNIGHTAGYKDWQNRFPDARLYAARDGIPLLKRLKLDDVFHPINELDVRAEIACIEAPGTRTGSLLIRSQLGKRSVVFVDELLINLKEPIKPFFMRFMFALTRTKTGLGINNVFQRFLVSDRQRLAATILSLLSDDPVCIPAHGDPLRDLTSLKRARSLLS